MVPSALACTHACGSPCFVCVDAYATVRAVCMPGGACMGYSRRVQGWDDLLRSICAWQVDGQEGRGRVRTLLPCQCLCGRCGCTTVRGKGGARTGVRVLCPGMLCLGCAVPATRCGAGLAGMQAR